jgi:hypothetical protein
MKIQITQKLRPFSHRPGVFCVIPGTHFILQAFPSLLRFADFEYALDVKGPVKNFTVLQDLEKNCLFISGKGENGFYRYRLQAFDGGFELYSEKTKHKKVYPYPLLFSLPNSWERLSLGSHKAQDWDLVVRRDDLKEILPVLFGLSQKIPSTHPQPSLPMLSLLKEEGLHNFCRAAFSDLLVPRLNDEEHLGLLSASSPSGDPFVLFQEFFSFVRSLFFKQNERRLEILPSILFPEGRLIQIQAPGVGEIDLEWASKKLRRVIIRANCSGDVVLILPKEITSFRVRGSLASRGKKHLVSDPQFLESGKTYFFDRFEK